MTQNRGRGLANQPIPPHKISGDSTASQRTDQIIRNAENFAGKPKDMPRQSAEPGPRAARDATAVTPSSHVTRADRGRAFDQARRDVVESTEASMGILPKYRSSARKK